MDMAQELNENNGLLQLDIFEEVIWKIMVLQNETSAVLSHVFLDTPANPMPKAHAFTLLLNLHFI